MQIQAFPIVMSCNNAQIEIYSENHRYYNFSVFSKMAL